MNPRAQALAILHAPIRFHEVFRAQVADTLSLRVVSLDVAMKLAMAYRIAMDAVARAERAR